MSIDHKTTDIEPVYYSKRSCPFKIYKMVGGCETERLLGLSMAIVSSVKATNLVLEHCLLPNDHQNFDSTGFDEGSPVQHINLTPISSAVFPLWDGPNQ
jgi:hypothetical protein